MKDLLARTTEAPPSTIPQHRRRIPWVNSLLLRRLGTNRYCCTRLQNDFLSVVFAAAHNGRQILAEPVTDPGHSEKRKEAGDEYAQGQPHGALLYNA